MTIERPRGRDEHRSQRTIDRDRSSSKNADHSGDNYHDPAEPRRPAPPTTPPRTPNDGAPDEAEAWRQTRLAVSDDEEE